MLRLRKKLRRTMGGAGGHVPSPSSCPPPIRPVKFVPGDSDAQSVASSGSVVSSTSEHENQRQRQRGTDRHQERQNNNNNDDTRRWSEPYEPPPIVTQSTVLAFGFFLFALASLWPPLILLVTYLLSKLVPYSFRINDDASTRRQLYREYVRATTSTSSSITTTTASTATATASTASTSSCGEEEGEEEDMGERSVPGDERFSASVAPILEVTSAPHQEEQKHQQQEHQQQQRDVRIEETFWVNQRYVGLFCCC